MGKEGSVFAAGLVELAAEPLVRELLTHHADRHPPADLCFSKRAKQSPKQNFVWVRPHQCKHETAQTRFSGVRLC